MWQFLQFPLTRIVLAGAVLVAVRVLIESAARAAGIRPHTSAALLVAFAVVIATLATYYGYVRFIERRPVAELGSRGAPGELARGLSYGALLFGTVMLVLISAGIARVSREGDVAVLGVAFVAALVAAVWEEALFRGVLFRIVEERLGSWIALALSAALFGGLHAFNPGATVTSSVAVGLEAGVLLGAAYMYSRRLWMPIGVHAGWNFTEGDIFGANVSGGQAHGLLASHFQGPEVLTGARFGPEASLVAVATCLMVAGVFLVFAIRRGQLVPRTS
jgi:membrane protease YdiL (CAAX protease family)